MSSTIAALAGRRGSGRSRLRGSYIDLDADQVSDFVERVAGQLRLANVRTLAIAADNSPDWVIVDLAAQRAGIAVVPLAPFFSPEQVAHMLTDSGVDAICADELGSQALQSVPTRFAAEVTPELTLLTCHLPAPVPDLMPETAKISYTSGTTATPKGVCLSQQAMGQVAESLCQVTGEMDIERHLCLLPLAVLLENIAGVYAPMLKGAEIVVPSLVETGIRGAAGLDTKCLLACLEASEPDSVILLPQILAAVVNAVENGAKLPGSLKFIAVGGAAVGRSLLDRAERLGLPVFEGYGLTECASVVSLNTPQARRAGSVGRPLPHCRVRLGSDGEILVDGASMGQYLGDSSPQPETISTGDVGHIDADGFLFIDGRKKNLIITSFGRNLSPEWVEAELIAANAIAQAALFGDSRPFNVAVIVPAAGATTESVERAIAEINRRLPDYARVRRWVQARAPFSPANAMLTENGRIRRREIEACYDKEIGACYLETVESYA